MPFFIAKGNHDQQTAYERHALPLFSSELEREVKRKDKALAETAALLVLSKKLSAVFGEGADE